ncbi:MAG: peptidase domain-containing ABC transporter [Candidatus Thiodiazotropha sp.]
MKIIDRLQLGRWRKVPLILQTEAAECGLACLAMCTARFGFETDLSALRARFSLSLKGMNLQSLIDIAARLGLVGRALRLELDELYKLETPCILHWDLRHFVVLTGVRGNRVTIYDPAIGERKLSLDEVGRSFTGVALMLTPGSDFTPAQEKTRVRIRDLLGKVVGLRRSLIQILLVSLALESVAVVLPWFNQWIIDDVVVSGDHTLLSVLVIGMLLLSIFQLAITSLRAWLLMVLGTHMNLQWASNVFSHLIRLPISYFEKRHLGDVISRFGAVDAIRQVITNGFVETVVDSIMAVIALSVMFFYSVKLTLLVICAALLYVLLRLYHYRTFRTRSEEEIVRNARLSSMTMESIRGVQSIKLFNFENSRLSTWTNQLVDLYNARIAIQKFNIGYRFGHGLLVALENSLVIWLAASMIMERNFTIGMLFAYLGYKEQFISKISAFIDRLVSFKLLSIQSERLSDIVLHPKEADETGIALTPAEHGHVVELRNVWFRYADGEPWILKNLNLRIEPGDSVYILGPSGCGKTTLIKLLLGLLPPVEGEVLVDGVNLQHLCRDEYRALLGAVMQEDQLFAGSIQDNVVFFDPHPDIVRVRRCLAQSGILEEIMHMPMGLQTLVGDMGTTLSGGQKQRLLIARALYKNPEILILDEVTSHLDKENQAHVLEALLNSGKTHISITHREELLRPGDRVLFMYDGQLTTPMDEECDEQQKESSGREK